MLYTTVYVLPLSTEEEEEQHVIHTFYYDACDPDISMSSDTHISLSLSYIWGMWYHHPVLMYLCCGKQLEYKMIDLYHKSALKKNEYLLYIDIVMLLTNDIGSYAENML